MEFPWKQFMTERRFQLPDSRGTIEFSIDVLSHMYEHAQRSFFAKEAGGQLFSPAPQSESVSVSRVTGPYSEDRRSRCSFHPNIQRVMQDRENFFRDQFYPIGIWHTHPEPTPHPSPRDKTTTLEYLAAFQGEMDGFLLVIIGNQGATPDMTVWIAWGATKPTWLKLEELPTQ